VVSKVVANDTLEWELKGLKFSDYVNNSLGPLLVKELNIKKDTLIIGINSMPMSLEEVENCERVKEHVFNKTKYSTAISIDSLIQKPSFLNIICTKYLQKMEFDYNHQSNLILQLDNLKKLEKYNYTDQITCSNNIPINGSVCCNFKDSFNQRCGDQFNYNEGCYSTKVHICSNNIRRDNVCKNMVNYQATGYCNKVTYINKTLNLLDKDISGITVKLKEVLLENQKNITIEINKYNKNHIQIKDMIDLLNRKDL